MSDDNEFDLTITIHVSLAEAETIEQTLFDADEDHLAEHVKYCIRQAKQQAGFLLSK